MASRFDRVQAAVADWQLCQIRIASGKVLVLMVNGMVRGRIDVAECHCGVERSQEDGKFAG